MDDPTEQSGGTPSPVRRRVVPTEEPESREGRIGCLIVGAVLGIAIGALFTFFALPPLLNHYFGEQHIGVGGTYEEGGKEISVLASGHSIDTPEWAVDLSLRVDASWSPSPGNFELELDSGRRIAPTTAALENGQPIAFQASGGITATHASLLFPDEPPYTARPRYFHIKDLNVRFELPQATP